MKYCDISRRTKIFSIFVILSAVYGLILLGNDDSTAGQQHYYRRPNQTRSKMRFWMRTDKKKMYRSIDINHKPKLDGMWQPVHGTRDEFYVYAAYIEFRKVIGVRIIAITARKINESVFCQLWLPSNITIKVPAWIRILRDNGSLKFSGAYVMCLLQGTKVNPWDVVDGWVSVISTEKHGQDFITNMLVVRNTKPSNHSSLENKIHICVKPFNEEDYYKTSWLLEWLLFNTLLEVSHFYMYNHSMNNQTSKLLEYFQMQGLVTVLPWELPVSQYNIREDIVAYHDCLYRSMLRATWLLILDANELLIPRVKIMLFDFITTLEMARENRNVLRTFSSFIFKTSFFYTSWEDDPESKHYLITSRKTRRVKKINTYSNHSKYMVRPSNIIELGRHDVMEYAPREKLLYSGYVPESLALLHKYEAHCYDAAYKENFCLQTSVVDQTAKKWSDELWSLMKLLKQKLKSD